MRKLRWSRLGPGLALAAGGAELLWYAWTVEHVGWWWVATIALVSGLLLIRAGIYVPARPSKRLGELLLEKGWTSEGQLGEALARQHHTKQRLGQILVEMGAITRFQLVEALQEQARYLDKPKPSPGGIGISSARDLARGREAGLVGLIPKVLAWLEQGEEPKGVLYWLLVVLSETFSV